MWLLFFFGCDLTFSLFICISALFKYYFLLLCVCFSFSLGSVLQFFWF
jgi:hypothetical protein